jgi:hypothetical protein
MSEKYIKYFGIFLACILIIILVVLSIHQIETYKLQDDPILNNLRHKITTFFSTDKKWSGNLSTLNNRDIMNEINFYRGTKSYTINKEKVYICLKDENGEYYSENMLMYVLAHELSHVLAVSIGHTEEFHRIFENLLVELTDAGLYDPSQPIVSDYCDNGDYS